MPSPLRHIICKLAKNRYEVYRMKTMKKTLIGLLIAAMLVFGLGACTGADEPYVEEPETPGYEEPVTLPETLDPEDLEDLEDWDDEWVHYDIFVNGVGLPGVNAFMPDEEDLFPSHVPLIAVLEALGAAPSEWDHDTSEVTVEGLNGTITFAVGSNMFLVDGETIELFHPALEHNGQIYVPLLFFRDVYGVGSAFSEGGSIFISDEAIDDMH